jgi:hypothetical protein
MVGFPTDGPDLPALAERPYSEYKTCNAEREVCDCRPCVEEGGNMDYCELPKGHKGAHRSDSMAGRIAWLNPDGTP